MEKVPGSYARYRIRRVGLGSLSKLGCVLGAVIYLLPSLLVGSGGLLAVRGVRRLLESWQQVELRLLGQPIPIDVVSLLHLEGVLRQVQLLDGLSVLLLIAFVAAGCGIGGLLFLIVGDLAGWVYNLVAAFSGGLEVELGEVRGDRLRPP
ncbi:MAG: hypothetical protein OEV76_01100 [Anaerolineae bacterium]|nr:hypothetical protein [Anaerolineae bacterium]